MEIARAVVDLEAPAKRVETNLCSGETPAGQGHGIRGPARFEGLAAQQLQFAVDKPQVEFGVMNNQGILADEIQKLDDNRGEGRVFGEKLSAQPMNLVGRLGHVALRIDVSLELPPGGQVIGQLQTGDFDNAIAVRRIEARGFGIEDDLTHGTSEQRGGGARDIRRTERL